MKFFENLLNKNIIIGLYLLGTIIITIGTLRSTTDLYKKDFQTNQIQTNQININKKYDISSLSNQIITLKPIDAKIDSKNTQFLVKTKKTIRNSSPNPTTKPSASPSPQPSFSPSPSPTPESKVNLSYKEKQVLKKSLVKTSFQPQIALAAKKDYLIRSCQHILSQEPGYASWKHKIEINEEISGIVEIRVWDLTHVRIVPAEVISIQRNANGFIVIGRRGSLNAAQNASPSPMPTLNIMPDNN